MLLVLEPELPLLCEPELRWCVEPRDLCPLFSLFFDSPKAKEVAPKIKALVRRRER